MAFRANWTPDQYMNIIRKVAPAAVPDIEQAAQAGQLDKHKLREIQEKHGHDDITPGMTDNDWLNGYLSMTKIKPPAPKTPAPVTPEKPDSTPTQPQKPQQPSTPAPKGVQDQAKRDAYMRLKNKQGTDADLDMFAGYTEEQLKNIGFGPVSIKAIMDRAASKAQTATAPLPKGTTNGEEATAAADAAMQKRHHQEKVEQNIMNMNPDELGTAENLDAQIKQKKKELADLEARKSIVTNKNGNGDMYAQMHDPYNGTNPSPFNDPNLR